MTGIDNWEYAEWCINIGRSLRFNPSTGAELTVCQGFYSYEVQRRSWLDDKFDRLSEQRQGLVTTDNPQIIGREIEAIGRNMLKIQVIDIFEKLMVDILISATGDRRYGAKGNRVGSNVTLP